MIDFGSILREHTTPQPKAPQKINIVLNWFEELKQRVPVE